MFKTKALMLANMKVCLRIFSSEEQLGPDFGRMDFFADFYFWAAGFFSRIFSPDFFSSFFVGKSAQKNPPGKSPGKSSKIYTTKTLQPLSADCPGQE